MQFLPILGTIVIAITATQRPVARPEVVAVRGVPDGGTIEATGYGRIHLAGVKAPRVDRRGLQPEPFADEARQRLEGIVTQRFVRLEFAAPGSRAAYVLLEDGTLVNAVLAAEGLVRVTVRDKGPRAEALRRAQASAQAARRGIWGLR